MSGTQQYFGLWCWPESRWITGWDLVRDKGSPVADSVPIFLNAEAAADAAENLPIALHRLVLIRPFCEMKKS